MRKKWKHEQEVEQDSERSEHRAYQAALRYLAARPRTVAEMRRKLGQTFSDPIVETVTLRLTVEEFLDDLAFARQWQESRLRTRPRSTALLRYEMIQRGVPKEQAEAAIAEQNDEEIAYRAGLHFARRLAGIDDRTFRQRLGQHLHRRGFAPGVIRRTVECLWEEGHRTVEALEKVNYIHDQVK